MRITNVRQTVIDGMPALQMEIDGTPATLIAAQKINILRKYGAVFLGAAFEDDHQVKIPADASIGQPATTLYGYTQDEEVVRLYTEFIDGLESQ
jgi:hypothetical protein